MALLLILLATGALGLILLYNRLAQLNVQVAQMKQVWEQEKQAIDAIRSLKEEL